MTRLAATLILLAPALALADGPIALQAEVGGAAFVAGPQTDRFSPGAGGAARVEVPIWRALSLQAGASAARFADGSAPAGDGVADPGASGAVLVGGGARIRPLPFLERLWIDADASWVRTGSVGRLGFDGGVGYDAIATGEIRGAPMARYTHVLQPDAGLDGSDAQFVTVGLAVTWGRSDGEPVGLLREYEGFEEGDAEPDADSLGEMGIEDDCPDAAEDADGFEDGDGCLDGDDDGDGFADAQDQCPREAEVVNGVDDDDGCPDEGAVAVVDDTIVLGDRIFFETGKARIRGRSAPLMEAVAAFLTARSDLARVRIEGHADDRGNARYNRMLSERRARNVLRRLVSLGIDPTRLEFVGFGTARPWQPGRSGTSRQANRRVEFRIVETADGRAPREAVGGEPAAVTVASAAR